MIYTWRHLLLAVITVPLVILPGVVSAFGVTPAVLDLQGAQDSLQTSTFEVVNTSDGEQTYYFRVAAFEPDPNTNAPVFAPLDPDMGFPNWIILPTPSLRVPARSRAAYSFSVQVPSGAPPESSYAAILVSRAPAEVANQGGASIEATTAVLLFMTVEGNESHRIEVIDMDLPRPASVLPYLGGNGSVSVQNQGTVYERVEGEVLVRDLFGRTVRSLPINENKERILPGATKVWPVVFGPDQRSFFEAVSLEWQELLVGPVTIQVTLRSYGEERAQHEERVWIIPWHLGIMGIGSVGIMVLAWYATRRILRRN